MKYKAPQLDVMHIYMQLCDIVEKEKKSRDIMPVDNSTITVFLTYTDLVAGSGPDVLVVLSYISFYNYRAF